MEPNISIVLLCYRSGEDVRDFVDRLRNSLELFEKNWEIVLVGNYFPNTKDPTPDVVKEIASNQPRIKAVVLEKSGTMGWDMRSGLNVTSGKNIAVIDGDGQMPLEDVARVYKSLIESNYDMVKTYRVDRKDGFYRYNLRDVNSKPKILKRKFLDKMDLQSNGWFIDAEIMIIARQLKMKVLEIPTTFNRIETRPSFVKPWAVFEFLINLLSYRTKEIRYRLQRKPKREK